MILSLKSITFIFLLALSCQVTVARHSGMQPVATSYVAAPPTWTDDPYPCSDCALTEGMQHVLQRQSCNGNTLERAG